MALLFYALCDFTSQERNIKMTKDILRIFPGKRNQYTPDDNLVYCANHKLDIPIALQFMDFSEIHISCTFTWDKTFCDNLLYQLEPQAKGKPIKLGGVAYNSSSEEFVQGMYIKENIIFTSRGCDNDCPWCIVPKLEGSLKELPICQGNVIQDNNFLQTSQHHKNKVVDMLRTQKGICFKGGLEPDLIDDHFIDSITSLKISELWLACDAKDTLPAFKRACEKLTKAGFGWNEHRTNTKIKCYALIGDNRDENEARLQEIYNAGAMPFAQLYRDFGDVKTEYNTDWNAYARMWQRPAATRAHMEKGTNYTDF